MLLTPPQTNPGLTDLQTLMESLCSIQFMPSHWNTFLRRATLPNNPPLLVFAALPFFLSESAAASVGFMDGPLPSASALPASAAAGAEASTGSLEAGMPLTGAAAPADSGSPEKAGMIANALQEVEAVF